ncbi:uncharacterized protein [Ptychodera flava]|uniref:uncharacterized protein n=1 Tax=Ptychodera flava TaxID=63121 RepID=UPI00396A9476
MMAVLNVFFILAFAYSVFCKDGVRIVGGRTSYEGIVEVFVSEGYITSWMRVCDTDRAWTMNEADVVCRQLGLPGAMWDKGNTIIQNDYWAGIWLTDIKCTGNETIFQDCEYDSLTEECKDHSATISCNHAEYLGCFQHNTTSNFSLVPGEEIESLTIEGCLSFCSDRRSFAGVQNGSLCYCLNAIDGDSKEGQLRNEHCQTPCSGNDAQACGGPSSIGIYNGHMGYCGNDTNIRRDNGTIYSPGFPGGYANNSCRWVITTAEDTFISSTFTVFDLKNDNDTIVIEDNNADRKVSFSKADVADLYIPDMSANEMIVTFHTDDMGVSDGQYRFAIQFEANTGDLGERVTGERGTIYSPDYPAAYPQVDAEWNIFAPNGSVINISFPIFELNKKNDKVVVIDVESGLSETFTKNNLPGIYISTSNRVDVTFTAKEASGDEFKFALAWKAIPSNRSEETIQGLNGTVVSPFYPLAYPTNMSYTWYIQTEDDALVKVMFLEFFLRENDYVEIGDSTENSSSIVRYYWNCNCGLPKVPYSNSNQTAIRLSSSEADPSAIGRFRAIFYAVWSCYYNESVENGQAVPSESSHKPGENLTLECDKGYLPTSNLTEITCLENGTWDGKLPDCAIATCEDPEDVDYGYAEWNDTTYGNNVTYSCYEGYTLNGSEIVTCQADAEWSAPPPVCIVVSCDDPGQPDNGYFEGVDFTHGSNVTYYCHDGYILNGTETMTCLINGTWDSEPPTCYPVSCGDPGEIENGNKIGENFTYESEIKFVCNEGYTLNGTESITCLSNGYWSDDVPTCVEAATQQAMYIAIVTGCSLAVLIILIIVLIVCCRRSSKGKANLEQVQQPYGEPATPHNQGIAPSMDQGTDSLNNAKNSRATISQTFAMEDMNDSEKQLPRIASKGSLSKEYVGGVYIQTINSGLISSVVALNNIYQLDHGKAEPTASKNADNGRRSQRDSRTLPNSPSQTVLDATVQDVGLKDSNIMKPTGGNMSDNLPYYASVHKKDARFAGEQRERGTNQALGDDRVHAESSGSHQTAQNSPIYDNPFEADDSDDRGEFLQRDNSLYHTADNTGFVNPASVPDDKKRLGPSSYIPKTSSRGEINDSNREDAGYKENKIYKPVRRFPSEDLPEYAEVEGQDFGFVENELYDRGMNQNGDYNRSDSGTNGLRHRGSKTNFYVGDTETDGPDDRGELLHRENILYESADTADLTGASSTRDTRQISRLPTYDYIRDTPRTPIRYSTVHDFRLRENDIHKPARGHSLDNLPDYANMYNHDNISDENDVYDRGVDGDRDGNRSGLHHLSSKTHHYDKVGRGDDAGDRDDRNWLERDNILYEPADDARRLESESYIRDTWNISRDRSYDYVPNTARRAIQNSSNARDTKFRENDVYSPARGNASHKPPVYINVRDRDYISVVNDPNESHGLNRDHADYRGVFQPNGSHRPRSKAPIYEEALGADGNVHRGELIHGDGILYESADDTRFTSDSRMRETRNISRLGSNDNITSASSSSNRDLYEQDVELTENIYELARENTLHTPPHYVNMPDQGHISVENNLYENRGTLDRSDYRSGF